ncbi:SGNH/GDSL hydrolase family protein [uncultured Mucilaginibacter sp.]|uniref:SGNH/GDSL hydrolase family protein n=1 Tax=uncultured Mucilaginibacter sp. TaxID=797541 RepID=UPI0025E85420|nr:SGNH/GDSL hydrolase family protein [uncultured Mucilaginibacter sp.]
MNIGKIIAVVAVSALLATNLHAQTNVGFENGFSGWQTSGKNISIDNSNARNGKSCVKMGPGYAVLSQHVPTVPLAVIQFTGYVKVSDTLTKAYSFVRFFNAQHKQLLEYKSGALKKITYDQTGNYTLAPPFTAYMEIGIATDAQNKGNVYVDDFDIQNNVGAPKVYRAPTCNLDQYMRPFWKGDTVYNETVLLYSAGGKPAIGKLLYMPSKILSVKKFDLYTTYKSGVDYKVDGNVIERLEGSSMPFKADTSFDRKTDLAWYNTQSQWVVVTYIHNDKWSGPIPQYKGNRMPRTIAKLRAKQPLKIAAYGMSITRGMDVSGYDDVPPYMPTYVSLFTEQLKKDYRYKDIQLYNAGLPGSVVDWGAQYADEYISALKPDLVILDFGMNDFWRYKPDQFKGYIQTIMQKVKAKCPKVEFILLSNMKFDPDYVLDSDKNKVWYLTNMVGYSHVLKQLETLGAVNLNMTEISDVIYHKKKAKDCIANPLHPNDYIARWYAQGLTALLFDLK